MKNIKTFGEYSITEAFDSPVPLTYTKKEKTEWMATADIDGNKYIFELIQYAYKQWEMVFYDKDDQFHVTGGGSAFKVMSTALAFMRDFNQEETAHETLSFSAYMKEPSRVKLYTRMVDRFAKSGGYIVTKQVKGSDLYFTLTKK